MAVIDPTRTKQVAILIENGFEDYEFQVPYKALKLTTGTEVTVLGSQRNEVYQGKQGKVSIRSDGTTTEARPDTFDAVIIPGGMAPDTMRNNPNTVRFVQEAMAQGKLIAAVCHGPQVLINGDLLRGKNATGFISIRQDMINAGASYADEPLVVDGNLITSRQPGDLAIFTTAILNRLGVGGPEAALPEETDRRAEWWKIADAWGGSTKSEIVGGLNQALAGERYSREAFEHYAEKTSDPELRSLLQEMIQNKQRHIQDIEEYLSALGEGDSLKAKAADTVAKVKSRIEGSDDQFLLQQTLDDLQKGVVDAYKLWAKFTDPVATALFTRIEQDLAEYERQVAQLYQARAGVAQARSAQPATGAMSGA